MILIANIVRLTALWLVALCLWPRSTSAQVYDVTRYADHNGLPSRIIRDVIQDQHGFIWVAGNNGLFKFDGKTFKAFYSSLKDTTGLRVNKIYALLDSEDGMIWVGTPGGLHVVEDDHVRHVPLRDTLNRRLSVLSLLKDSKGHIWIGTDHGLYQQKLIGDNVVQLSSVPDENLGDKTIWTLHEDHRGRIWASTPEGPYILDPNGAGTYSKPKLVFNDGLEPSKINAFGFIEHAKDEFIVESSIGLLVAKFRSNSTLHFNRLMGEDGTAIPETFIYKCIIDSKQNIWCATWKNNIQKFRLSEGRLIRQAIRSRDGQQGMFDHAISVHEDRQGNIWVANANGLFKFTEGAHEIFHFPQAGDNDQFGGHLNVSDIALDTLGYIWLGTTKGLYRLKKDAVTNFEPPQDVLHLQNSRFSSIRRIMIDAQNRLWITSKQGLAVSELDNAQRPIRFSYYTVDDGLEHNWCEEILQFDESNYWLSSYTGLIKVELADGDISKARFNVNLSSDEKNFIDLWTTDIEWDAQGALWVASGGGLSELYIENSAVQVNNYSAQFSDSSSISSNLIKNIFCDSEERVWVGTQKGLNLLNPNNKNFTQFGREDGLPDEYILGIQQDSKGALWIATVRGIMRAQYDEERRAFTDREYFTINEGLSDNITNRGAFLIDDEDHVFVGNSKGLNFYKAETIQVEPSQALLTLSSFSRKNGTEGAFELVLEPEDGQPIKLKHDQNSIELSYILLDLSDPLHNEYRHQISILHDTWIETQNVSDLRYYALAPGTYEISLDGRRKGGSWSENPIKLQVIVSPPFWRSGWAYALYCLILIAAIRLVYFWQLKRRIREVERKAKFERAIVAEREILRQENAADFHDELGSMISKISIFLSLAETHYRDSKDPLPFFQKIRDNVSGLSGRFRDLLWVIDPAKDNLNDTFLHLKDLGEELFDHSGIDLRTGIIQDDPQDISLSTQTKKQIVMIFKEAMTNCAKHADCSRAELQLRQDKDESSILFSDNGKGMSPHTPTQGRGLKNMRARAAKCGMKLHIESSSKGTKIKLQEIPSS